MAPSQLKRLKTSLREQGITGPAKSKKQKQSKSGKNSNDRVQRNAALQQIRDSFNPFEIKAPSRPAKFEYVAPDRNGKRLSYKDVLHRPGVTKSAGEEVRRATLLPELQRRNKVGMMIDRRIGEGDPEMTAEEKAVQRFAQEKSRKRRGNLFNLEASDDDELKVSLTHGGRSLDDLPADDFGSISGQEEESEGEDFMRRKRGRELVEAEESGVTNDDQPERKKTKKEVMEEVIAKSKFHKYERQKAKEDDDDLREELDSGLQDILSLLHGRPAPPSAAKRPEENGNTRSEPAINPDRQKLLDGEDRSKVDKEYDARLKQLAQDARAKPSERTKTEEEKAAEEATKLRTLEERRLKRMRGEEVSDDEADHPTEQHGGGLEGDEDVPDEAAEFGFTSSNAPRKLAREQLVLDDEDEFALDEDLVASESGLDEDDDSLEEEDSEENSADEEVTANGGNEDEDDEFVKDILGEVPRDAKQLNGTKVVVDGSMVAYTYPCPGTHQEFLAILKDSPVDQLPTIIQRIRALHHPSLAPDNKEATAQFSSVLVDHLSYMGIHKQSLVAAEQVIRHLHSLSRSYAETIASSFRRHLGAMHDRNGIGAGDLIILTAIGSIYPTSDHFHQVVTPAMTIMARWLGLNPPNTPSQSVKGAFLVALGLKYQALSRRYIPEALRFTYQALERQKSIATNSPHIANLLTMAKLWHSHSSFPTLFAPFLPLLPTPTHASANRTLTILLHSSRRSLRPLELHHHKPLAIRTSVPKFEEGFHPDKHYDADRDRAAATKLRKEVQRERKGALRELRKDASFLARASLREKKERDAEYERKYRRLVAEVQGEEGHAAKEYEREKRARKMKAGGGGRK